MRHARFKTCRVRAQATVALSFVGSFAKRLCPYLAGILAHCRWPLGTNLIKVIKCMAYGFRDDAYFFLKIHAAFRGDWRRTKKKGAGRSLPRWISAI